jgi:putative membrane protein
MKKISMIVCCFILLSNRSKAIQPNTNPGGLHRPLSILSTPEANFLTHTADELMADIKEGKEARLKAVSTGIRNYGGSIVKENTLLLSRLQKLAHEKRFRLPSSTSKEKKEEFKELISKSGKDFDKKFLRMIKTDHKRDIRETKKAITFNNKLISVFAREQLPVLQSQLDKLKTLMK